MKNDFTEGRDTLYGIVRMYVPKHKPRKMKNASPTIALYMPCDKPLLLCSMDTCLAYESDNSFYEIYNPNKHSFDFEVLKRNIVLIHRYSFIELVGNFRVVSFRRS